MPTVTWSRVSAACSTSAPSRPARAASVQARAATAAAFGLDTTLHTGAASGTANAVRVEGKDPGAYANRDRGRGPRRDQRLAQRVRPPRRRGRRLPRGLPEPLDEPQTTPATWTASSTTRARLALRARRSTSSSSACRCRRRRPWRSRAASDGLVGLDDNDFIGSEPGQDRAPRARPGAGAVAAARAGARHAGRPQRDGALREVDRDGAVFAVLDPPANQSATDIVTYVATTAALENLSEFAAVYWPRVKVLNPAKSVFGSAEQLVVPPSGIVAGVFSRTDSARPGGVYDPPAGIEAGRMFGVLGFETDEVLEERKRDLVYPHRINPLTTGPGCRATSTARARSRATATSRTSPSVAASSSSSEVSSRGSSSRGTRTTPRGSARRCGAPSRRSSSRR
jgi:hypothetical protein